MYNIFSDKKLCCIYIYIYIFSVTTWSMCCRHIEFAIMEMDEFHVHKLLIKVTTIFNSISSKIIMTIFPLHSLRVDVSPSHVVARGWSGGLAPIFPFFGL